MNNIPNSKSPPWINRMLLISVIFTVVTMTVTASIYDNTMNSDVRNFTGVLTYGWIFIVTTICSVFVLWRIWISPSYRDNAWVKRYRGVLTFSFLYAICASFLIWYFEH